MQVYIVGKSEMEGDSSAGLAPKSSRNLALENRLRKPQTAAGFVPKACETQARKTAERHLWNPYIKNNL